VHGFNTGFETAILRAAQLGDDTQWPCMVTAFSWNSAGKRTEYASDRANAAAAEPLFADFLRALNSERLQTSIVAHSMGTQLVLETLARGGDGVVADKVIFAAPDIGTADFSKLVHVVRPRFTHLTIYTSDEDVVLAISPRLNHGAPRLGRDANNVRDVQNLDVIDASDAPAGLMGHGYYGLSYEMLADMSLALAGETAERRAAPRGSQPPTLERRDDGSYKLAVSWKRAPTVLTRALRWFISLFAG
jgi:esterase/lipase superfamily enzyme